MKLNRYRRALVSLSLVLFLGFGWSDSLRFLFDYLFLGSVPAATQQVRDDGDNTAAARPTKKR